MSKGKLNTNLEKNSRKEKTPKTKAKRNNSLSDFGHGPTIDDDVKFVMGDINVQLGNEDEIDDEVVILPDIERPGYDDNWEPDFNTEDTDDFLQMENLMDDKDDFD